MIKNTYQRLQRGRMLSYTLQRYKGIPIETNISTYVKTVDIIRSFRHGHLTDAEILSSASRVRTSLNGGTDPRDMLPEYFALTAEAAHRVLGLEVFDVQLIAALVMNDGKLAQVRTGEGKTLSAVFPAAFNALTGRGVHIMTANDYLAARDADWMGDIYRMLGLSAAFVREDMGTEQKRTAYSSDITYLTVKQAGFDFLADCLCYDLRELCRRPFYYCIVDEADFLLIDEARNPMVIAGRSDDQGIDHYRIDDLVRSLCRDIHYTVDRFGRNSFLTLKGQKRVQESIGCGGIHEEQSFPVYAAVNVALQAHHLLIRDVDYIVRDGRVEMIDESTGRIAEKRRWPYGIQTALEIKEGLEPREAGEILSSISVQHFIALYPRIAAMTATAVSAAREFDRFYGLTTVVIPPNNPERMEDLPDLVFSTRAAKVRAIVNEIAGAHGIGRPILIGTGSVKESMELSSILTERGIGHSVLNAKNDEREAALIAEAGLPGAVTISTNMAGRGTDIRLGGHDGRAREGVVALGGLYVISTSRFESIRVDNQLRGRAGRQGDPGSCRFFVSLEDDLVRKYAITDFIARKYFEDDGGKPIPDPVVAREISRAQEIIEEQHFQMRTTVRRYTALVERQRQTVTDLRNGVLMQGEFPETLLAECDPGSEGIDTELLKGIFLSRLDEFWGEYLAWVDHIREGIHLRRLGQEDPLLAFLQDAGETFDTALARVIEETAACFLEYSSGEGGTSTPVIRGPSGTWTYLINDNPFPNFRVSLFQTGSGSGMIDALSAAVAAPVYLGAMIIHWITWIGKRRRKRE